MKISKLFHWLYAILMFLPILVFIPNAFYYGFNEHALAQEKTEQVPVYYESNDIVTSDDFIIGNIYHWGNHYEGTSYGDNKFVFTLEITENLRGIINNFDNVTSISMYIPTNNNYMNLWVSYNVEPGAVVTIQNREIDFVIKSLGRNFYEVINDLLQYFSKCNIKYLKGYEPLTTNMSITDSMSYAWKSTWQNDLFSWSYDSFLTQPFLYITNLFNVPATNTLLYCLSYWLNISIIWLCFDVVMYVPLLVHRWLDKGIVE